MCLDKYIFPEWASVSSSEGKEGCDLPDSNIAWMYYFFLLINYWILEYNPILYSAVLVSGIPWSGSAMCIHICPLSHSPPTSLGHHRTPTWAPCAMQQLHACIFASPSDCSNYSSLYKPLSAIEKNPPNFESQMVRVWRITRQALFLDACIFRKTPLVFHVVWSPVQGIPEIVMCPAQVLELRPGN